MEEIKINVLEDLHRIASRLQALLRGRPPLSETEQLFIENRLMIMQIEYQQWFKEKKKDKGSQDSKTKVLSDHPPEVKK